MLIAEPGTINMIKTGTNYTIRDDEMVIDLSDLNAGDFTDSSVQRYPLSNITVVGDSALPLSVYATTFRSKLTTSGSFGRPRTPASQPQSSLSTSFG